MVRKFFSGFMAGGVEFPKTKRPVGWAEVALLAILVLLGRVPSLFFHHSDWDEAALMAESWAMTRGQVLYKDIVQIHPPLNFAILVPFFHVFRPEWVPLGERWPRRGTASGCWRRALPN